MAKKEESPERYVMPAVSIGDWVTHFSSKSKGPEAALVTQVGDRAISLLVFPGELRSHGVPYPGVRHIDDTEGLNNHDGFWDFSDSHKDIIRRITNLERSVSQRSA